MNYSQAFEYLLIEVTKDENAIKMAYRKLLSQNNPEENPEGFKLLRQAYEVATEYARSNDEETGEQEFVVDFSNPVSVWLGKVHDVYKSLSRRFNIDEWKKLLEDEVFYSLDYCEEAQRQLLYFLMDNFRITRETYILLDEKCAIVENEKHLMEYLPKGFVDFMVNTITDEQYADNFEVKYLECEDDADYDTFRQYLLEMVNILFNKKDDKEEVATIPAKIQAIESLNIIHPRFYIEKARYYAIIGDVDKANEILDYINSRKEWNEIEQIVVHKMCIMVETGRGDAAKEVLEEASKKEFNYSVERALLLYYYNNGEFASAKEHIGKIAQYGLPEEIYEFDEKISDEYIKRYELTHNLDDWSELDYTNLLVAYNRQGNPKAALELMATSGKELSDEADKNRLAGIFHAQVGELNEGIKHIEIACNIYKEKIADVDCSTSTKEELTKKLVNALAQMSRMLVELSFEADTKEEIIRLSKKAYDLCEEAHNLEPDNINIKVELIDVLFHIKEYKKSYDIAMELLNERPNDFTLIAKAQRAAFRLGESQAVIDLHFRGIAIYPKRDVMYAYTAREFLKYNQVEDAKRVLEDAKNAGIEDDFAIRATKQLIKLRELPSEVTEVEKFLNETKELVSEGQSDGYTELSAYLASRYVEIIFGYFDDNIMQPTRFDMSRQDLIEYLKKNTKFEYNNRIYIDQFARLYRSISQYDLAIEQYLELASLTGRTLDIEHSLGVCYAKNKDYKNALQSIKNLETYGAENIYNDINMAIIYEELAMAMKNVDYYEKAARHFIKQVKKLPPKDEEFNYCCMRIVRDSCKVGKYKRALEYISKITNSDMDYRLTMERAKVNYLNGDNENAVFLGDLATKIYMQQYYSDYETNWKLLYNALVIQANAYIAMNEVDKALELWENVLTLPENEELYEEAVFAMLNICIDTRRYDETEVVLRTKIDYLKDDMHYYYYAKIKNMLLKAKTKKEYVEAYNEGLKARQEGDTSVSLAYFTAVAALLGLDDVSIACKHYEELLAKKSAVSLWDKEGFILEYIGVLELIGNEERKQYYLEVFEEIIKSKYPQEDEVSYIDKYLKEPHTQKFNLGEYIKYLCYKGEIEHKYIDRFINMKDEPYDFETGVLDENKATLAIYYEKLGDMETAEKLYSELIEEHSEQSYLALFRAKMKHQILNEPEENERDKKGVFDKIKGIFKNK